MLEVRNLTVKYGSLTVVDGVSLTLREGEWLMIAGPNGAGKSTLLGAISQGSPYTGDVLIRGRDARRMKPRERARWMGTLTQRHTMDYAFTVEEIAGLGRYAYGSALGGRSPDDAQAVADALRITGMEPYRAHSALTLSGGELQRAFLAQLFSQNPAVLLLDEPTNHLDPAYQKQIFELIRVWLTQPGRAVVSVVHDLSLALRYGTRALLMDHGRAVADGPVHEALSREALLRVYGMDVQAWMKWLLSGWAEEPAEAAPLRDADVNP